MPTVKLKNMKGETIGEVQLSDELFAAEVNPFAMHLVVRAILNGRRLGTQSALTRSEVRGGGRKIYRQKGTGNARHHGNRAPQFKKGGVVFAPKPRDYSISVPKKVRRLAMKSAFSAKVAGHEMVVIDAITMDEYKTKTIAAMLKAVGAEKKALIVLPEVNEKVIASAANIPGVKTAQVNTLNVYDILNADMFIVAKDAVAKIEEVYA